MVYSSTRRAAVMSLGACLVPGFTLAQESPTWNALRSGGHVLLIRHARAPGTFDPPEFKLGVCSTQRNLNDEGRAQAKRLGEFIREMQVPIGRVFSSEWCRCIETAQLAFGSDKVTTQATLSSPTKLSPEQRVRHTELVRSQINRYGLSSTVFQTNLVMVTHMFNIQDITGESVAEGEILVVKSTGADSKNPPKLVDRFSTSL
jgi:phosphohistidine phosphatase SixA